MHPRNSTIALVLALVAFGFSSVPAQEALQQSPYGKVELLRDRWGVPHVFADTDEGAMYGLGWVTAEDRGFQMYYALRTIQGRLSETLGIIDKKRTGAVGPNNSLEHDRLMRTFGFATAAPVVVNSLDQGTRRLLEAYSSGVDGYFAQNEGREHYLFQQLGLQREPWRPADCLLSWWHFAQFFSKDGLRDTPSLTPRSLPRGRRARIVVDDDAAVVRREDVSEEWIAQVNAWVDARGLVSSEPSGPETPEPKFSHAWVVGGERTTTGAAVLVSDPQTPVWNPNMLYEFHVQGATFNARGVGVAGSPAILIGFNQQVAWGVTALGADQADLFILRTDPQRSGQYQVDHEWLEMSVREDVILVKDDDPINLTIRETIFGPVVSEFVWQNPKGQEVALLRVPMAELDRETIQGAFGMMRAQSGDEFAAALPGWRFPTANCVFGDKQGNIGYWSLGALPVRSPLTGPDGGHAQDGSTHQGNWRGMIPYEILPHCLNPERGYLVSANHRTIQSFYPVPFGNMTGSSGDTDRGLRIKERILEHLVVSDKFTSDEVLAIHFDSVNVWKREIIRLGYRILSQSPDALSSNAELALRYLQPWYDDGARSDLSVLGTELVNEMNVIFRGGMFGLVNQYGGGVGGLARFAKTVRARDADHPDDLVPDEERTFVNQVLDQAWKRTRSQYGDDPTLWNQLARDALCRQEMGYLESLDGFPTLDPEQNVPLPLLRTIDGATVLSQRAQAYTQYVPLHDPDQALSILPIGISDNPRSPYRFATYGDWAQGNLHPAPLSRAAVEALAVSQETLGWKRIRPAARQGAAERVAMTAQVARPSRNALPGKKPVDPVLEMAIRFLNRPERTRAEVKAKLEELDRYVVGDAELKDELVGALDLFTYLMRESQAGRMRIQYGTAETLNLVEAFYQDLRASAEATE